MVGRLGAAAILAVGLAGRIGMFVWIIFGAIGTGTTVLTARAIGAGDHGRVRKIAWQGLLTAAALMGLVAAAIFIFAPTFMVLLNATPESLTMGVAYLRILVFSIPFQALFMVISAILRGTGNTRTPMQIAFCHKPCECSRELSADIRPPGLSCPWFQGAGCGYHNRAGHRGYPCSMVSSEPEIRCRPLLAPRYCS